MPEALATAGHAPAAESAAGDASPVPHEAHADAPAKELNFRDVFEETKAELSEDEPKKSGRPSNADAAAKKAADAAGKPAFDEAAKGEKQPEAIKAHDRWTAEEKATFETLPVEAKKAMRSQYDNWEKGFNKKFEEISNTRKLKEEIDHLFTPSVRQKMQTGGLTEGQVINKLAEFAHSIDTNPVQAIAHLMQRHRIDPRVFLQEQGANGQAQPSTVQQFAPMVQPLMAKIAELEQGQNAWKQQQLAEQERAIEATIVSVVEDKDATGAPKFPYMERVADRMAQLIEHDPRYADMDPRQRLEEAYTVAVFSDPSIRAEIATAEASKSAMALEQDRANGRLKAAATSKPLSSASGSKVGNRSFRDAYNEAKNDLGIG
jgi:hypothetical protein